MHTSANPEEKRPHPPTSNAVSSRLSLLRALRLPDARHGQQRELAAGPEGAVLPLPLAEADAVHAQVLEHPAALAPRPQVRLADAVVFKLVAQLLSRCRRRRRRRRLIVCSDGYSLIGDLPLIHRGGRQDVLGLVDTEQNGTCIHSPAQLLPQCCRRRSIVCFFGYSLVGGLALTHRPGRESDRMCLV